MSLHPRRRRCWSMLVPPTSTSRALVTGKRVEPRTNRERDQGERQRHLNRGEGANDFLGVGHVAVQALDFRCPSGCHHESRRTCSTAHRWRQKNRSISSLVADAMRGWTVIRKPGKLPSRRDLAASPPVQRDLRRGGALLHSGLRETIGSGWSSLECLGMRCIHSVTRAQQTCSLTSVLSKYSNVRKRTWWNR